MNPDEDHLNLNCNKCIRIRQQQKKEPGTLVDGRYPTLETFGFLHVLIKINVHRLDYHWINPKDASYLEN